MRMWMVDPKIMCRQHLLGEHVETHMFVGTINKNKCLAGYFDNNLLIVEKLRSRHEEIVSEMEKRGMKHKSPLPEFVIKDIHRGGFISKELNKKELFDRCENCRKLQQTEQVVQEYDYG